MEPGGSGRVLVGFSRFDVIPGVHALAIYADLDRDGPGYPVDLFDVIVAALRERYGSDRT